MTNVSQDLKGTPCFHNVEAQPRTNLQCLQRIQSSLQQKHSQTICSGRMSIIQQLHVEVPISLP